MGKLSRKQIERQDFVDNKIFELIQSLHPAGKRLEWDIEMIGDVRDMIERQVARAHNVSKAQFYPFQKI